MARSQVSIIEINPDSSSLAAPNGGSGGRVNRLGSAESSRTVYAGSERGGLFKSNDAGQHWFRIDTHLPTAVWDVKVSPIDPRLVVATSLYDGRVISLAGINVSRDGGATWRHASIDSKPGFCQEENRLEEPSAFGISIDPQNPRIIYVGTNCGLAVSKNAGDTWERINPFQDLGPADYVWAVLAHGGKIIDVCGNGGHRRSLDVGRTWQGPAPRQDLPSGQCSLAVSPDEPYVLFAVSGKTIWESDDGGSNWSTEFVNPSPQGRVPFVATNRLEKNHYNLWFGDINLYRASCVSPTQPKPGGIQRCPVSDQWNGPFASEAGAHDDAGDLLFDSQPDPACALKCVSDSARCRSGASWIGNDRTIECDRYLNDCISKCGRVSCPVLFASDGGVHINQQRDYPWCETPVWKQPEVTPHGLWALTTSVSSEFVYLGTQDNGAFSGQEVKPSSIHWSNTDCCDSYDLIAGPSLVVYTQCCYKDGRLTHLLLRSPGMSASAQVPNYPDGNLIVQEQTPTIARVAGRSYVIVTTGGVFITPDILANPIEWQSVDTQSLPIGPCGIWTSWDHRTKTIYVQGPFCSGSDGDQVWRYPGGAGRGSWEQVQTPIGGGGFGIFGVHPRNSQRLFASILSSSGPSMVSSTNGGSTWRSETALNRLMTSNGVFKYEVTHGMTEFSGLGHYVQPSVVAFSPFTDRIILVGARDSGIFFSMDDGTTWNKITDNSGNSDNPIIPHPKVAAFEQKNNQVHVYLGSQGRGLWRVVFRVEH